MTPHLQTHEQVIATTTTVVHDEALGIDRKIVAGEPVPPELVDAYKEKGGETEPYREPAPADATIAKEDRVLHDETLGIDRKVFAGQPVPADLVDAYKKATGETDDSDDDKDKYDALTKDELEIIVADRGLEVEGTGANGNVLVDDLRKALREDDSA